MVSNFRETKQRAAIRSTLSSAKHPLHPREIQELASKQCPNLGLATIYRNLKKLEQEGHAESVQLPGLARCYISPQKQGTVLIYCKVSGRTEYLSEDAKHVKLPPLPKGFELHRYDIVLRGEFKNGHAVE